MSGLNCLAPIMVPSILWGIYPILFTFAINELNYINVFIIGYFFNFIFILIFYIINRNNIKLINFKKGKKAYLVLFVGSILTSIASYYFYKSIKVCKKSYKVIAITYSLPIVLSTLGCMIFLREKISFKNIFGIILALIGINFIYHE